MLSRGSLMNFFIQLLLLWQVAQALPEALHGDTALALDPRAKYGPQCFKDYSTKKPTKAIVTKTQTQTLTKTLEQTKYVKSTKTVTAPKQTITKRRWTVSKTTTTVPNKATNTFSTTTTIVQPVTATVTRTTEEVVTKYTTIIGYPPESGNGNGNGNGGVDPLRRHVAPSEEKRAGTESESLAHLEARGAPPQKYKGPKRYVTGVTCIVKTTKTIRPTVTKTAKPCTRTIYPRPAVTTTTKTIGVTISVPATPAKTTTTFSTVSTLVVDTSYTTTTTVITSTSTIYEAPRVTGTIRVRSPTGQDLGALYEQPGGFSLAYSVNDTPLKVSFPVKALGGVMEDIRVSIEDGSSEYPYLILSTGFNNPTYIGPGSFHYVRLDAGQGTPPNSKPADLPTKYDPDNQGQFKTESDVWKIDIDTGEMTFKWTNSDETQYAGVFNGEFNYVYGTGDRAAFESVYTIATDRLTLVFEQDVE